MTIIKPLPQNILFVCLGNICRSPSAEEVFRENFKKLNLAIQVDSAGTAGYHEGESSDPRTIAIGKQRGYNLTHKARQISLADFEKFELILCMDDANLQNLLKICPQDYHFKIKKLTHYSQSKKFDIVPDPYYGDSSDFHLVLDIIEECFKGFKSIHIG